MTPKNLFHDYLTHSISWGIKFWMSLQKGGLNAFYFEKNSNFATLRITLMDKTIVKIPN